MRRLCVCGGGSVGHVVSVVSSAARCAEVTVLTRHPNRWSRHIRAIAHDKYVVEGTPALVTDDPKRSVQGADIVLLTVPAFARAELFERISPHLSETTWLGCVPGTGGFAWQVKHYMPNHRRFFGFQRVPWVCRTSVYGSLVNVTGVRRCGVIGLGTADTTFPYDWLSQCLGLPLKSTADYLAIELSFDNAIFHTPRLFSLFQYCHRFAAPIRFYANWDDRSSDLLLRLDSELDAIRQAFHVAGGIAVREHFGAWDARSLTMRIQQIEALGSIMAPLRQQAGDWVVDWQSRYFQEDFAYGLAVLRRYASAAGVETPTMDALLDWSNEVLKESGIPAASGQRSLSMPNFSVCGDDEQPAWSAIRKHLPAPAYRPASTIRPT